MSPFFWGVDIKQIEYEARLHWSYWFDQYFYYNGVPILTGPSWVYIPPPEGASKEDLGHSYLPATNLLTGEEVRLPMDTEVLNHMQELTEMQALAWAAK